MAYWTMDLNAYADKRKKQISTIRKEFVFKLLEGVVEKTPAVTGRAKGNWQVSVGSDNTSETDRKDKEGSATMSAEGAKIPNANDDKPIFIVNNVPYIKSLEYGKSKQAPNGMVGLTLAEIQTYMNEVIGGTK